jgi:hypothetical protein
MEPSSDENKKQTRPPRKPRSLCLSFANETEYERCLADRAYYRTYLMEQYQAYPELFPEEWGEGFHFHGFIYSRKQDLHQRRVKLKSTGSVYQIRPSFMMPYMIGRVVEVEKPLFLRRWGVPFEALTYVFGRHPMYWYRAYVSLGRTSLVGTTIKQVEDLPPHLIADEKHTRLQGKKVFVPTTVAQECILGAEVVEQADADHLEQGYQVFRDEAQTLQSDYTPQSVNTDKWPATRQAWSRLFPATTLILCFLHAVLKIKNRCRSAPDLWELIRHKVWHVYKAESLRPFAQRLRRLREWTESQTLEKPVQAPLQALWESAADFKVAYQHPGSFRTSNGLERLMDYQDRLLYTMRYFHGTLSSAKLYMRAMALVWNFHPYGRRTQKKYGGVCTPFERLNGFQYHDNWLENMMIAASLRGQYRSHKIR